ncbi:MAG TPA: lipocalin-like domain-containing protein [Methanobacterium sp.]|nr:lipocalin-like domain-containing protein [Methanobacterium sp.]
MEIKELKQLDEITKDNIARVLWAKKFEEAEIPENILNKLEDDKNSPESFGKRMQYKLQELINDPDSFTPSYKKRYHKFIENSNSLYALQAYAMNHLLGLDSVKGYKNIPNEADLKFPDTHLPQLGYQVGWHFFVGNCKGENDKDYGILFMFYRYSLLPPTIAKHFGLSDLENQIFEFQLAVGEAGNRHYQSKPLAVAGTTGLASFSNTPFNYRLGNNSIQSLSEDNLFPLRLRGWGVNLEEAPIELEVDIRLNSNKEFLLQGKKGCLPCCCDIGTLYYSATNLSLDPSNSSLNFNGEEIKLVDGKFWFDHQWGNALEPLGNPRCEVMRAANNMVESHSRGWDWFMAQFEGKREMTMYAPHTDENLEYYEQTGTESPQTMTVKVKGQLIEKDNTVKEISGTLKIPEWIKSKRSSDPNQYWVTNTWYPNKWEFSFDKTVPEDIRNFTMTPIVQTGQSGFNASGAQYSEGAVYIKNNEGNLLGKGFAESVYYANVVKNMLHLSDLPVTPEMIALVKKPSPGLGLKIKSFLYFLQPSKRKKLEKTLKKCIDQGLPTSMVG